MHGPRAGHKQGKPEMAVKFSHDVLKTNTKNTSGDFIQQSRFSVEADGAFVGGIHKVEGLEHEHEMISYQDADDHFMRVRPGRQKCGTLVLHRAFANTEFFDWFKTVLDGNVQRKSMSIVHSSDDNTEVSRINLHECWPCKWKLTGLNSRTSGHIVEELHIKYEKVEYI